MKLNIACGNRVKPKPWINVDARARDHPLDYEIDVTQEWLWEDESVDEIYIEQFLEHLVWFKGRELLENCYNTLEYGGKIRIVIPDFKETFRRYLNNDKEFFKPYFKALNTYDLPYYTTILKHPEVIRARSENIPPEWHFTDKERVKERCRPYDFLIEVVNRITHQFGEHKTLYDFESLVSLLLNIGFSKVYRTEFKEEYDSNAPTRKEFSLYVEAIK